MTRNEPDLSVLRENPRPLGRGGCQADNMYQRALKAEELLCRFYIDRDKKAEEAILNFVQDGLDKEGLL